MAVVFLFLIAAVYLSTPVVDDRDGFGSDGRFYASMAGEGSLDVAFRERAPYCWRILTPALAASLPFSILTNFRVLAFVSNYLSLLVLYALLRSLQFNRCITTAGVMFYAGVFWTTKFSFFSPAYIDYQTQLLLLALLLLMVRDKHGWMIPAMSLAVLQKESLLATVGVVYSYDLLYRKSNWSVRPGALYAVGLFAVPLLMLLSVRAFITPTNDYSAVSVVIGEVRGLLSLDRLTRLGSALFSGLGILPVLVLYGIRPSARYLAVNLHWGVLVLTGVVFLLGGVDKSRLFLYALPAFVVLATHVVSDLTVRKPTWLVTMWLIATLGIHLYIGNYLTPMGSFSEYLARMVPEHAEGTSYTQTLATNLVLSVVWLGSTWLLFRSDQELVSGS
jgi:hypothetical protein